MKILFLLPTSPWPPNSGARIRNDGLVTVSARHHGVEVLTFQDPHGATATNTNVTMRTLHGPPPRGKSRRLRQFLGGHNPDLTFRYWSPAYASVLEERLSTDRIDAVQAEGLEMAGYLRDVPKGIARIYDAHNAEYLLQRRAYQQGLRAFHPAASVYSLIQWRRLLRFEQAIVRAASLTLAVSEHDANQLECLAPGANVQVVPNAINLENYPFRAQQSSQEPNILFLGKLDFRPNTDALEWLVREILPLAWRTVPGLRLFAVGHCPPRWLIERGQRDPRIVVTGLVTDERPYLQRTAALVLPFQVGGGSRLKALVAFATGTPVVSTPLGVEGLDVEPGKQVTVESSAAAIANALVALVSDPERGRQQALAARQLVEQRYGWNSLEAAHLRAFGTISGKRFQ